MLHERALEETHAFVHHAGALEQLRHALDHVEVGRPAQRRDPRARHRFELGRRDRLHALCVPVILVVFIGVAAHQLGVGPRPAWRGRDHAAEQRKVVPLRFGREVLLEQRLGLLGIDRQDQIVELLADRELQEPQRRELERCGQAVRERARDLRTLDGGLGDHDRDVALGLILFGHLDRELVVVVVVAIVLAVADRVEGVDVVEGVGLFAGVGALVATEHGVEIGLARGRLGRRRPGAGLLHQHRRHHPHHGHQLVAGDRLELAWQGAEPARGEPRGEDLLHLLAEVLAERIERLLRAIARQGVQPHRRRLGSRELEPHQLVAPGRGVEPIRRRRPDRRVRGCEVPFVGKQRCRVRVVHREARVALTHLDQRDPQEERGLGLEPDIRARDRHVRQQERDAMRLAQGRH